jgi:pyruvate,water dikinase
MTTVSAPPRFIRWFDEVGLGDLALVGGKNAALGDLIRSAGTTGVRVPAGFAITTDAYRALLDVRGLGQRIRRLMADLDADDPAEVARKGGIIRHLILETPFPPGLSQEIVSAYQRLSAKPLLADVAVRSSATAEDLPEASFAGQQESYLNVQGAVALLDACHRCFASLYTDRAIAYRRAHEIDHAAVALSSCSVSTAIRSCSRRSSTSAIRR